MDAYPTTLVLGAAVLVAARLLSGSRGDAGRGKIRPGIKFLQVAGWLLMAAGLLSVLQLALGRGAGLLFWLASLVLLSLAQARRRQAERNALLWVLSVAAERQVPLPAAAEAYAEECGGRCAQRVRRLAEMLRAGVSLPECLRLQRRLLSDAGLMAARAGSHAGALGPALREAAAAGSTHEAAWQSLAGKLLLLYWAGWAAIAAGMFAPLAVVPAIREIFESSAAELPAATRFIVDAYEVVGSLAFVLIPLQALLGVVLPLYLLLNYLGWAPWRVPPADRLMLGLDAAVVLRAVALYAERGRPLPEALDALSKSRPRRSMRRRLARAADDARQGRDWCESLAARGLARTADVPLWRSAERAGSLSNVLRSTAERNERRVVRRWRWALHAGFLAMLAGLGLGTAIFVGAFLLPLIEIIGMLA